MNKTDRKLMQQALEALYSAPLDHNSIESRFFERRHHAIAALRERLDQPEQEPVVVIKRNESGQIVMQTPDGNPFDMSKYIGSKFYTAPQQREWQGLFFDAVYEAWYSVGMDLLGGDWSKFAKTLEDKLKETK